MLQSFDADTVFHLGIVTQWEAKKRRILID